MAKKPKTKKAKPGMVVSKLKRILKGSERRVKIKRAGARKIWHPKKKKLISKTTKEKIIKKSLLEEEEAPTKPCPECGSLNVVYSQISDELICKDCGVIFAELSPEQEERFQKVREQ